MTGEDFHAYRAAAQRSIRQLAIDLKVDASTIHRWETGASPIPSSASEAVTQMALTTSVGTIRKLAAALGVEPAALLAAPKVE